MTVTMAAAWLRGIVKEVVSGDTVVVAAATQGPAVPPEKRLTLSSLVAPRLGKRDGSTRDEAFAWESREFLRKKLIGQPCVFKVDYVVEAAGNKEFGSVFLQQGTEKENVAVSVVQNGWAKVREATGPSTKNSPFYEELLKAQEAAQAGNKGLWTKDPSAIQAAHGSAPLPEEFNAMAFLSAKGKGKPVAGLVEAVLNGSTLRLTLLPERTPVTVTLAGVQCPSMGKRPAAPAPAAAAAAAPEANGNGAAPEANGTANGNGAAPAAVTAASIAASGVSAASAPGGAEPFSREAKWFTESRVLNREVRVVLEGVDKYNNLFGSVVYPEGEKLINLGEAIMQAGVGKAVEWSLNMMTTGAMKLRELERTAKQNKAGIWRNYVPQNTGQTKLSDTFVGKVVEVVSGDTIVVKDVNAGGAERRISLSSVRGPRAGGRDRAPEPYGLEAREFLRKKLIGKEVTVKMEYTRKIGFQPGQAEQAPAVPGQEDRVMSFGNVELNNVKETDTKNAAEMVVARGFGSVVRHRSDEERSSVYERLLELEENAKQNKRGIHSNKEVQTPRVNDVSTPGNGQRAKQYLPFLQRAGKLFGTVENVSSGHRLKVHVPKEGVTIAIAPSGVRAPQRPMPAMGGRPANPGEPFGEEAYSWTREHFNQREVEIEVEACDKGGTFLGTIVLPGPKPINLGLTLARMGLAKTQQFFAADRVKGGQELVNAIQEAKQARRKVWENWSPEDDVVPGAEDEDGEAASSSGAGERLPCMVTEVVSGNDFFLQSTSEPRVSWLEEQLRNLGLADGPAGTGLMMGSLCAGKFSLDGNWYRGYIERVSPVEPRFEVYFMDFGNKEKLNSEDVRPLDAALSAVPPQARPACLAYVKVPELNEDFGADAASFLAQLVGNGKRFVATVVRRERGLGAREKHPRKAADKLQVVLKGEGDDKLDVAREMLLEGLARLPRIHKIRDPALKAAVEALADAEDDARRAHRGIWEHGDPGDSDDEEPAPRAPAWGKKK